MAQYDGSIRILTKISTDMAEKSLGTLSQTIKGTAKEIASLHSKMDALKGQKVHSDDYKSISEQISKGNRELDKLLDKQFQMKSEGKDSGKAWENLNKKIRAVDSELRHYVSDLHGLEQSGKAFKMGEETQEYANLERQLQYEEEALRKAQELQKVAQSTGDPYGRLSQSVSDLNKRLTSVLHPVEAMKASFSSAAEKMKAKLAGMAATIINGINHPFQTMRNIANFAIGGTSKLLSGMSSIAKKVGKTISGVASMLKKAASSMSLFGKGTNSASGSMKNGLKTILKYGFGIRSLYVLVNKLRSAIKEGFSNLYNDTGVTSFKNTVDGLRASLLTLKNSFAVAFAPLVTVVIPYIQKAVDYISIHRDRPAEYPRL